MKMIGLARLTRDAVLRYTPYGDPVANFSVAYNYGRKDPDTGDQPVQFVDCALWGKRAESLSQYLLKGKRFLVELSDVHMEEYEGRNGKGVKLAARITDIQFADQLEKAERAPASAPQQSYAEATGRSMAAQAPAQPSSGSVADMEDDIPFACLGAGRAWAVI